MISRNVHGKPFICIYIWDSQGFIYEKSHYLCLKFEGVTEMMHTIINLGLFHND